MVVTYTHKTPRDDCPIRKVMPYPTSLLNSTKYRAVVDLHPTSVSDLQYAQFSSHQGSPKYKHTYEVHFCRPVAASFRPSFLRPSVAVLSALLSSLPLFDLQVAESGPTHRAVPVSYTCRRLLTKSTDRPRPQAEREAYIWHRCLPCPRKRSCRGNSNSNSKIRA